MNVLVVDDERDASFLFQQHFKKEIKAKDLIFHYALSAEEALQLLDEKLSTQLVLILSDINMPGMNGLELLKMIKQKYPHMAIFIITAYGDPENCQLAWQYGASEILNKPIDFSYLKNLIVEFRRLNELKGSEQ